MTAPLFGPHCQRCGQYGHTYCEPVASQVGWLPGWVCPVCGTGVSPWRTTHCDKPQPSTVTATSEAVSGDC